MTNDEEANHKASAAPAARLSGAMRAGALSALEECVDALAVYRRALEKRPPAAVTAVATTMTTTAMHDHSLPTATAAAARVVDIDFRVPEVSLHKHSGHAAFAMATEELIFQKLQQDSEWLEKLLIVTKESLAREGDLGVLMDEVERKLAERDREDELLSRARELQEKLEQMRRSVAEERDKRSEEEERLKRELLKLRNDKKRLDILHGVESEYVDDWLDSRREQQRLEAEVNRKRLNDELRCCEQQEINETIVAREVVAFFQLSIQENEKSAQDWTERRLTEIKRYERDINVLKEMIEKKRAELDELRREYDVRQEFIDSCLVEREAKRRRLELEEYKRRRAVKIQAWWRGVMVRRKLGPYRPEDKRRKRPVKPKK